MPELEKRLHVVLGGTDRSMEKVQDNLRDLVDLIALRSAQVGVLLAFLAAMVLGLHRFWYGRRPSAHAAGTPPSPPSPPPPAAGG
jgi:hypothetical protein